MGPELSFEKLYGYTEPIRRLIQREETTPQANEIPNTMPTWLPGDDYLINFRKGDPFSKIDQGYARLPGAGYTAIHPELKPGVFVLGHNKNLARPRGKRAPLSRCPTVMMLPESLRSSGQWAMSNAVMAWFLLQLASCSACLPSLVADGYAAWVLFLECKVCSDPEHGRHGLGRHEKFSLLPVRSIRQENALACWHPDGLFDCSFSSPVPM